MSNVTAMPGYACLYFEGGKCLFEERLNPGYNESWRCREILRWEQEYDRFMDQAERFGLDEKAVTSIWTQRFEKMTTSRIDCREFAEGGEVEPLNCCHLLEDMCLLSLPACNGVCKLFVSRQRAMII